MSTKPPPQPAAKPADRFPLSGGTIAALVGAGLLLAFMLQNQQDVRVHLLLWRVTLPVWFIILGSALLGAVIWVGFGVLRRRRHRKAGRETRRG